MHPWGGKRGRIDCKWEERKMQGERAWYFGLCNEVAYSLASCGMWMGSCLNFFTSPCYLSSFTLMQSLLFHQNFCLPSSCYLLTLQIPGFIYWGFDMLQVFLPIPDSAIGASNIRTHVDSPPSPPTTFKDSWLLSWNHPYFHFSSATLSQWLYPGPPERLAPPLKSQTLVLHSLSTPSYHARGVLVLTPLFPLVYFFGLSEVSAHSTSDF